MPRESPRALHLEAAELLRQDHQRSGGGQGQPTQGKKNLNNLGPCSIKNFDLAGLKLGALESKADQVLGSCCSTAAERMAVEQNS